MNREDREIDWTAPDLAGRLRALWCEVDPKTGRARFSTAEIGRQLECSKNAVIGKARRLELPPRPSPIKRGDNATAAGPAPKPRHRSTAATLPSLQSIQPPSREPVPAPGQIAMARPMPAPPRPAPARTEPPKPFARVKTCCWPIGEPGTKGFRFCDGPAHPGRPYCGEHIKVAYRPIRPLREEAAAA